MSERTDRIEASAKEMITELQQARDEARLQLHLGGMEAKEAFTGLEGRLLKFETQAHAIGDDAVEELGEAFGHLREAFRKLRANLETA